MEDRGTARESASVPDEGRRLGSHPDTRPRLSNRWVAQSAQRRLHSFTSRRHRDSEKSVLLFGLPLEVLRVLGASVVENRRDMRNSVQ
jgi:hypothetical protein